MTEVFGWKKSHYNRRIGLGILEVAILTLHRYILIVFMNFSPKIQSCQCHKMTKCNLTFCVHVRLLHKPFYF